MKEISNRLERAEQRYRSLLESVHDGIALIDEAGLIQFANRRLESMFGYGPGELNNQPYEVLIPTDRLEMYRTLHAELTRHPEVKEMGSGLDLAGKRKDGSVFAIDTAVSPVNVDSHPMTTTIIRDVSERKRLEEERADILRREHEARLDAERANRIKDEFLATLSHELRTPLTAILSWTQILRLGKGDTAKGLALIEKSAMDQSQLIDDLLDVSRIQAGKMPLELSVIDSTECVSGAVESVRALAEEKSLTLETTTSASGQVSGDSRRLLQALRNLLTNAIKFTAPGGTITVQLTRRADAGCERVQIQVRDTGIGIRPDVLPKLFTRFTQADSSTTRGHGGLGLGLSIVRHIVEMHGGTVRAESAGQGHGAVFTVELPGLQEDGPAGEGGESRTAAEAPGGPTTLSGLRVLVVDDIEGTRDGFRVLLESLGAEVRTAGSADEGFAALLDFTPDVLLCDIAMPGEDGYQLIRRIRALPSSQGGRTPAAALTAHAGGEDIRRALGAEFDRHLAKPVDVVTLSHAIATLARERKDAGMM